MTEPKQVPDVTDERLCWLAVQDHIDKKTRKVGFWGWIAAMGGSSGGTRGRVHDEPGRAGLAGDIRRSGMSDKKADYAVAVDAAASRLSRDERARLRATGEVPDWFVEDIERRVEEIRKQQR